MRPPHARTAAAAALAAALAAAVVAAADQAIPPAWTGDWSGSAAQSFALANADDPRSWECINGGARITRAQTLASSSAGNTFDLGPLAQGTATVGAATYVAPAVPAAAYTWAAYDAATKILSLRRTSDERVECHYAQLEGTGSGRRITMVSLGAGDLDNDWVDQCNPASCA